MFAAENSVGYAIGWLGSFCRKAIFWLALWFSFAGLKAQPYWGITVGAERIQSYLPYISGRRVGIVGNHTTLVGKLHLVDTLLALGVNITAIFSPEHGFRGNAEAGAGVKSYVDAKTGIPVFSLYGSTKKPTPEQLQKVDIILFDIQDVGVRFYTYISTMHYVMEACAEHDIPLLVLDRPNPNGFYVDGPVLNPTYRSFVGMHPVPLVHGMTIGEYARMVNGEGWLADNLRCNLTVIPCKGYNHRMVVSLPVKPSPNLPNLLSVMLYPSLGLFEGTMVSVGRGTDSPFQIFGFPEFPLKAFSFRPVEKPGASVNPPYKGIRCYGVDLRDYSIDYFIDRRAINLDWLIFAYRSAPDQSAFFNTFFRLLAGTGELRRQIEAGMSSRQIRASWQEPIRRFKQLREKYLLYDDFE